MEKSAICLVSSSDPQLTVEVNSQNNSKFNSFNASNFGLRVNKASHFKEAYCDKACFLVFEFFF